MINFVVVDDDAEMVSKVEKIIHEVMIKNNFEYRVQTFLEYNDEFYKLTKENSESNIYILDIVVPGVSGIDVAREIRSFDVNSVIIFLTGESNLNKDVSEANLLSLTYIYKYNNSYNRLVSAIEMAIFVLGKKKYLRFSEKGMIITIPTKDILYITRETLERKSIIVTEYHKFKTNKPLNELLEMLGNPFRESHRACLINMDRVRLIDKKNKSILFDNDMTIDLISTNFKLEEEKSVRNI